jgi:regulator of protease activity HflC (stomatin/prohibitin superfamily)
MKQAFKRHKYLYTFAFFILVLTAISLYALITSFAFVAENERLVVVSAINHKAEILGPGVHFRFRPTNTFYFINNKEYVSVANDGRSEIFDADFTNDDIFSYTSDSREVNAGYYMRVRFSLNKLPETVTVNFDKEDYLQRFVNQDTRAIIADTIKGYSENYLELQSYDELQEQVRTRLSSFLESKGLILERFNFEYIDVV